MVIQARKRFVVAFVVAMLLAWLAVGLSAQHMPSGCKGLTPDDWEYWFKQCYIYATFPSDFTHRGFLVR